MTTGIAPRRPIRVTVLGVSGSIQGIVTLIVGIGLIAEHDDQDLLDHVDLGSDALLSTGLAALIIGALTLLLAIGLLRGAEWARLFIGILEVFHIGGGLYVLIAYEGSQRWSGLWAILIGLLVLWILFGSEKAEAFFEGR